MDFELTPEQEEIREVARQFAEDELGDKIAPFDERHQFPFEIVNKLAPLDPTYREVKFVMTPYTRGMTKKVALVAWHYVQFLDGYDQNAITQFYESHVNKGPESVP